MSRLVHNSILCVGMVMGVDVVTISTLAECHCLSEWHRYRRVTTRQYCGRTERRQRETFGVNSTRVVSINQKRGVASRIADERQGKRSRPAGGGRSIPSYSPVIENTSHRHGSRSPRRTSAIIIVRSIARRVRFGVGSVISIAFDRRRLHVIAWSVCFVAAAGNFMKSSTRHTR